MIRLKAGIISLIRRIDPDTAHRISRGWGWHVVAFLALVYVGIGIDSTTGNPISSSMISANNLAVYGMVQANVPVGVGYHYAAAMERGGAASTTTWYANNATNVYVSRVAAG